MAAGMTAFMIRLSRPGMMRTCWQAQRHQACRGRGAATWLTPIEAGNIARNPNAIHSITSSLRVVVS